MFWKIETSWKTQDMSQNKMSIWDCNISTLLQSHHQTEWFTKQAKVYIYSMMKTMEVRNPIPEMLTWQNALLIISTGSYYLQDKKVINNNWPNNIDM